MFFLRLILTALLAAATSIPPALASKADNSVRFAFDQTPPQLDPYFNLQLIGSIVADAIWDTLIFRDPETGEYKPSLATAWKWTGERTLELELRQGVKFHNGAAFDADDVVYTFGFIADPKNRVINTGLASRIERAEKLSAHTVRLVFKQPFPAALAYLAGPSSVIHPHEYYARLGPKGMSEHPIGTGPFRVADHALGKYIRLERNPDYFQGGAKRTPTLGKVEIRFIPDMQTRVAEAVAGGLDLTTRIGADQASQLSGLKTLNVVASEGIGYAFLALNSLAAGPAPALRDIRVRRAIMHAIDRDAMAKFLAGGSARVLHAECSPGDFGCTDAGVPRYAYDPAKARALLAEAGFKDGFDIDIHAFRDRDQTEAMINYLRAVGIRARLRFVQAGAMQALMRAGRVGLAHGSWSSFLARDISTALSRLHDFSANDMNRDPELHALLVRADTVMDEDARKAEYAKALALIAERAYVLPLYSLPNYYLAAKDLSFTPHSDSIPRFWEMSWK